MSQQQYESYAQWNQKRATAEPLLPANARGDAKGGLRPGNETSAGNFLNTHDPTQLQSYAA